MKILLVLLLLSSLLLGNKYTELAGWNLAGTFFIKF